MPIHIRRIDDKYEAEITPPHGGGRPWRPPGPMTQDELIGALLDRGCHQTDIGDAMFEADPEWQAHDSSSRTLPTEMEYPRLGGLVVPEPDWPLLIAELLGVRSMIHEIDRGQLWGYALPRVAATEADILAAEQRLGRRLDAGYRQFLTSADGWAHIAQDGLIFGTQDLGQGEDWAMAIEWLDAIAAGSTDLPVTSNPRKVLPIMVSRTTPSLAVQGGPEGDSVVRWYYAGSLVDRWPTFEDYFRALIELSLDDLRAVSTDPELRGLLGSSQGVRSV